MPPWHQAARGGGVSIGWRPALVLAVLLAGHRPAAPEAPDPLWIPLQTVAPAGAGTTADLQALSQWIGEARLVGLGESEHGTDDFHRLAHRVFAHLAQDKGFTVYALEVNQAHAARLDEFIQGTDLNLDDLMKERWWASKRFYDQALRDLLLWMRQYNRSADSAVHVAGFDFKQPSFAMAEVVKTLGQLDSEASERAATLYSRVQGLGGWGVYPNVYGFSADLTLPVASREPASSRLEVTLQVRTEGMSHGWVGLTLDPSTAGLPPRRRFLAPDKVGDEWRPVELEIEVPPAVDELRLTVFHRGNGTAWFSHLQVERDGKPLEFDPTVRDLQPRPLAMPGIQIMDYDSHIDERITFAGNPSLRVDCDPAVDEALDAVLQVDALLRQQLATRGTHLARSERLWAQQMSRLVVQACQWRTLVETNRDVFLAENASWLPRVGFPESRILALAHSYHTGRYPGKMGSFLAEAHGTEYLPITLLTLSGQYAGFGEPRALQADAPLRLVSLDPAKASPLAQHLATLSEGDLLFHLAAARQAATEQNWLEQIPLREREAADVAILVRRVQAARIP